MYVNGTVDDKMKVTCLYQHLTDGIVNRDNSDVANILKQLYPDLIFMGAWRRFPMPYSIDEEPGFFTKEEINTLANDGFTWKKFKDAVDNINNEIPKTRVNGAILPQFLYAEKTRNPITNETYVGRDKTWELSLDPGKWGIPFSRNELQKRIWNTWRGGNTDDPKNDAIFFFPDYTNTDWQKLFLSWARKLIDCGVTSLWIDMTWTQLEILKQILINMGESEEEAYKHPAVKESYKAMVNLINEIKKIKPLPVMTWRPFEHIKKGDYPAPNQDYVTVSPKPLEILRGLSEERWSQIKDDRNKYLPKASILVFMDWSNTVSMPLGVFSQKLSPSKQRQFLRNADKFFSDRGIMFTYPVHCGYMGDEAKTLSYGKYYKYDSLAPEFETYRTIKEVLHWKNKWKFLFPRVMGGYMIPRVEERNIVPRIKYVYEGLK